ncbi:MAG TPA: peptidoglycan DD-metalloendopeptidase family protein [Candidatus Paceibacterota bacterium]
MSIIRISILFVSLACISILASRSLAASPDELRKSIEEKAKGLQEINRQIQDAQKNLTAADQKSKSLNQEIKQGDYRINQLNLSIRASQLKIDKLELEVQSLGYDIGDKEKGISGKKEAIKELLRELQEKNRETMLMLFLRNGSLADSVFEAQSIDDLSKGLGDEISGLELIKSDLTEKLNETSVKKSQIVGENKTLKNRKGIVEDQKTERQELLKVTKNQEKLYQEQLRELEKQQAAIASEIEAIEKELRAKIDPNLLPIPRPGVLAWPAASKIMSQGYGQTTFALYNYRGKHHNGVDIAGPIGTEIYAAEDGEVTAVGNQDLFCRRAAYGKFIVIKHTNGLTTLYGHMSQTIAAIGDQVKRGQVIGYMGKTGWATGSHLHFTVWSTLTHLMKPTNSCGLMPVGGDINPLQYLERESAA